MITHADKPQENKRQPANDTSQKQSGVESASLIADNRPEAVAQRKMQEAINNSPRVQQLKAYQGIANNSPQVKQLQGYQTMADGFTSQTAQLKENLDEETLQGKFDVVQKEESSGEGMDEELLQAKFETVQRMEDDELLQGKFEPGLKPNNTGLPNQLKAGIENLSGMSMEHVKVHYNSDKPAQLQAHAYAQGSEIHVAQGQEKHLPHEAWHVVQQAQGRVKPTAQMKGGIQVNDDAGLESEADLMGAMALQKKAQNQISLNTSANSSNVTQLTTIAQRIIKPDTTKPAFMRDNDYGTKPKKTKEAIEAFFDAVKKSALIYTPDEMTEGIRTNGDTVKKINELFAKMEHAKSAEMDEDLGGERAHGVSRHLTISDDDLEARLRGPGAIAVASRFQTDANSGRAVLKLYNQIKHELPVFLKKHVGKVADDVLKIVKSRDYLAATNNAARRALIRDGAEITAPITEDFDNFNVTVEWEATNANCIAGQATIKCAYTVESSDDFGKDSWSLNAMGALVKNSLDETATMHSGSNSPVIVVLATDTSSTIEGKVAASNVDMVGVTMF